MRWLHLLAISLAAMMAGSLCIAGSANARSGFALVSADSPHHGDLLSLGSPGATTRDLSPRVRVAAKGCREECHKNGNNCRQRCR